MKEERTVLELTEELRQYQAEKEKVRQLLGQIGGTTSLKKERWIAGCFVLGLCLLFVADVSRHCFGDFIWLPPVFSLSIGILLVSLKIIWMIHNQTRMEHFQFWILNSIEFRVNEMSNRLQKIEENMAMAAAGTAGVAEEKQ